MEHKANKTQKREEPEPQIGFHSPVMLTLNRADSGVSLIPAERSGGHRYSNSHPVKGTGDYLQQSRWEQQTKASKENNAKTSKDAQKKGFRISRPVLSPGEKTTPARTRLDDFQVKMDDFPELAEKQQNSNLPTYRRTGSKGSPTKADFSQNASNAESDTLVLSTAQPAVTSWANIASQPPKKLVNKTTNDETNQTEDIDSLKEDGRSGKKKRKKKKKSQTSVWSAETESEHSKSPRQPPKFQDEEEFPDLNGNDRTICSTNNKLWTKENQRKSLHADWNREKSPGGKTQSTEASRKGQKTEKVSGKKSKAPVQLDIGNMLVALEKKQQSQKAKQDARPVILSVGGGLPIVQKQQTAQKKLPEKIAHNPLDSTSPLVKKGKQREVPKAKKPTPLKKVILKEREERKQLRLLEERGLLPEEDPQLSADATEEQLNGAATDDVDGSVEGFEDESQTNNNNPLTEDENGTTSKDVAVPKIHSRRFRDYCNQMLRKDVDECVTNLLRELVRFQDRLYQKDPMKARMKRRIVMGLREVLKHLKLRKVKCVIISPNCERVKSKGGLDEALKTIIDTCREQEVPFVFALSRRSLGRCLSKAVPVSLVGIFNYDGAQDFYHKMIELSAEARKAYEAMLLSLQSEDQTTAEENNEEPLMERPDVVPVEPEHSLPAL